MMSHVSFPACCAVRTLAGKGRRVTICFNKAYACAAPFLEALTDCFASTGRTVFARRNVVKLFDAPFSPMPLAVKRFADPGALRGAYYTWAAPGKAQRAFTNALAMLERGISTPAPVAFLEVRHGRGPVRRSMLVTESVTLPPIKPLLYAEEALDHDAARAFGRFVAQMHRAGIVHGDLNCDNVLVERTREGDFSFTLIDVNRATIYPAGSLPPWNRCLHDLMCFTRSPRCVESVARHYLEARGMDPEGAAGIARAKRTFNRRRTLRKRLCHPLRRP